MSVGKITYSRTPDAWSQEEFLRLGGFTVVFLNYNKARYIEKSVASALGQDFPLCEMFFMDDASTDGSGDTMERLVREYRGRHKVTVVRNDENQHICGQWNILGRMMAESGSESSEKERADGRAPSGEWFGMFCADDVAHPDRVSIAAKRIAEHPTIRGMCTEVDEVAARDDILIGTTPNAKARCICEGAKVDFEELMRQHPPVIGATAWWHRSLFDDPLPKGPMDDLILRWILQLKGRDSVDPIWLWDGIDRTIDYSVGTGITSEAKAGNWGQLSRIEKWLGGTKANRHFAEIAIRTFEGVRSYYESHQAPKVFRDAVRNALSYYRIVKGTTLSRVFLFPAALRCQTNRKTWAKLFVQEFFGLHFAAWVSCYVLRRV